MTIRHSVAPVIFVAVALAAASAFAQSPATADPPRTADGRPDLQGVWSFANYTPLERPEEFGDRETITVEEAAAFQEARTSAFEQTWFVESAYDIRLWFEQGEMSTRTSLIVDPPNGLLPALTEAGQRRADKAKESEEARRQITYEYAAEGPEDLDLWDRCILGSYSGPPIRSGPYNNNLQLFQNGDTVAILTEQIHRARVIPLDGSPFTNIPQHDGESRGHWEGDTLVVESRKFLPAAARALAYGRPRTFASSSVSAGSMPTRCATSSRSTTRRTGPSPGPHDTT